MSNWIYKVFLLTLFLSAIFSVIINLVTRNANILIILILIILVMLIAFIFDMIATSALTSKEASFHAKNSKKIKGAKESLWIVKNNVKVASICSDVIGDILGIASGALGAVLAINFSQTMNFNIVITSILVAAFISAFTVGGKAICKEIAVRRSDKITFKVAKVIHFFKFKKKKK